MTPLRHTVTEAGSAQAATHPWNTHEPGSQSKHTRRWG